MGGIGGRHQNYSLFSYNKIFCPSPLLCVMPIGQIFFLGGVRRYYASYEIISAPLKMKYAPNKKSPGHASGKENTFFI